jgi:acetyl esterase/lipase
VTVTRNLPYVVDGDSRHVLDIYAPNDSDSYPVLMFVSGGGWSQGDKTWVRGLARSLAQDGIGVVAVEHRLTPQVTQAEQAEDLAQAFAWIKANIAEYGGDPERVAVGGHSAGGHLTALMAMNPAFLEGVGLAQSDVLGVVSLSGALDVRVRFGRDLSPTTYIAPGLPPFLLLAAEDDLAGFERTAERFHADLTEQGVNATFALIAENDHFTILEDQSALQTILDWLNGLSVSG